MARRFMLRAVGLDRPHASVAAALAYHGFVQIDPINVCGRMHDHVLRNRVVDYREGDLLRYLYGEEGGAPLPAAQRTAFEHYAPGVLAALPMADWPYLVGAMRRRSKSTRGFFGRLSTAEERLAKRILGEIAARGPVTSDDIAHDARAITAWGGNSRMVKTVLEKLLAHGRALITRRRAFRRVYDLPERVVPPHLFASPEPAEADAQRWHVLLHLRQRRLVILRRQDVACVEDLVQPVQVDDGPRWFCLRDDVPLFQQVADEPPGSAPIRLLAPLDPLIYDRRITRRLWDFDYTWEVYTPPAKRVRGYYALPVLAGEAIVGHVDAKAERTVRRRLVVVSRSVRRGHRTAPAVAELARFLGLRA